MESHGRKTKSLRREMEERLRPPTVKVFGLTIEAGWAPLTGAMAVNFRVTVSRNGASVEGRKVGTREQTRMEDKARRNLPNSRFMSTLDTLSHAVFMGVPHHSSESSCPVALCHPPRFLISYPQNSFFFSFLRCLDSYILLYTHTPQIKQPDIQNGLAAIRSIPCGQCRTTSMPKYG